MKPAKRLDKIGMWFKGPHSPDLFKALYVESQYAEFETVSIGTGESKAVAAARAIAHLHGKGYGPVLQEIHDQVERMMPDNSEFVEGDGMSFVYCILGVSAER